MRRSRVTKRQAEGHGRGGDEAVPRVTERVAGDLPERRRDVQGDRLGLERGLRIAEQPEDLIQLIVGKRPARADHVPEVNDRGDGDGDAIDRLRLLQRSARIRREPAIRVVKQYQTNAWVSATTLTGSSGPRRRRGGSGRLSSRARRSWRPTWRSRRRDSASPGERPRVVEVCWRCWRGPAAGGHGRRGGVPERLTGQRRLARAVEDDVVRFRLPALLPFAFEPGGVHRSTQAEVVSL